MDTRYDKNVIALNIDEILIGEGHEHTLYFSDVMVCYWLDRVLKHCWD